VIYGFAGLVDGIVERFQHELSAGSGGDGKEGGPSAAKAAATIATGGFAELVVPHTKTLDRVDPLLTLKGLKLVHERNERN
jgi:type III pantothenate kinase